MASFCCTVASSNHLSSGFMKRIQKSYPSGTSDNRLCTKIGMVNTSSVKAEKSNIRHRQSIRLVKALKSQTSVVDKTVEVCQGIRDTIEKDRTAAASSPFDTAWVAMVPSPSSPQNPCFPECLKWILENQKSDGSWDSSSGTPTTLFLIKEALSSTLACVIALKRWNVNGHKHIQKGLQFIVSNFKFALDEKEYSPLGFNIIFSSMLETAKELGLKLRVNQEDLDIMFQLRDSELKRVSEINSKEWKDYIACIAEGIHGYKHHQIIDWKEVILKYQLNNGSLFNSPSATAAALIHHPDANGHQYLRLVLQKFGNAVPTAFPFEVYTKLNIIDSLQKLGIERHFQDIIENFFSEIYKLWVENDEKIFSDMTTCAMAFRLLRMQGYEVSSGVFEHLKEDRFYYSSTDGNLNMKSILELYNASHIKLSQDEKVLDKLNFWTRNFLEQNVISQEPKNDIEKIFFEEVDRDLKFPSYSKLERIEHKWNIIHFAVHNIFSMPKSFSLGTPITEDMLRLAVEDFNACQSIHQNELAVVESWSKENKLDHLKSIRQKVTACYWATATTSFSPDLVDVRMSAAKNAILATVVDDLFDITGSIDELENFVHLVERWDEDYAKDHSISEQVHVIFSALYSTTNELGAKASALHGWDVTSHFVETWEEMVHCMMTEAKWRTEMFVPTPDQYVNNGYITSGLGPIIFLPLFFVGPKLPLETIKSQEYQSLVRLVCTCGRLLNDLQTVEKEAEEGKLNSVSLHVLQGNGKISTDDAKCEIQKIIESNRTELLRLVVRSGETSLVPRACKDVVWKNLRVHQLVYARNDGFTSPTEMMGFIRDVIFDSLNLM